MATVHWPGPEVDRDLSLRSLRDVPFVVTESCEYPDGVNRYIFERSRGKLSAMHRPTNRILLRPLAASSCAQLAHALADLITWGESAAAHPTVGEIRWDALQAWHITDLWQDQMLQGFWSAEFFRSKSPSPLSPETVKTKVSVALGCYCWLRDQGCIRNFDYEPVTKEIELAKDRATASYRREMAVVNEVPGPRRPVRKAPGAEPLPSLSHLEDFLHAIPSGSIRLAVMTLFETGMRCQEVIENTLIPKHLHQRGADLQLRWRHPAWPNQPYRLDYSLSDDRMIGVLPTREEAWSPAHYTSQCGHRILGKGHKIRKVHLPPRLLRRVWTHIDSDERGHLARERATRGKQSTAFAFLNQYGDPLSSHAIWDACDRANKGLKTATRITPHSLRHAYACYFLEGAILQAAAERGFNSGFIPYDLIMAVGNTTLMVLQNDLGHAEMSTTRRYLQQIASGRMHFAAHKSWNSFLDRVHPDAA